MGARRPLLISPYPTHFPFSRRMACIEKDTSSTDPDKWLVCEMLILLLFFSVEWLFSLFVLVQLLKCCEHRA